MVKRPLRDWYRRTVYYRLYPEHVSPIDSVLPKFARITTPYRAGVSSGQSPVIVCLPIIDWFFRYQRPQQLLTRLAAQGYRIFYVDPCLNGLPYLHGPSLCERWTLPLTDNVTGIKLPTRLTGDIYSSPVDATQVERLARDFQDLTFHLGIGEATLLVQLPFWTPLALQLRRDLGYGLIYDCLDDHAGFSGVSTAVVAQEAELIREADLVIASSTALFEKVKGQARQTVLAANGCDYAHFANAAPVPLLADLPRPVIGYYGAIAEWFDAPLVAAAARARPDASFVLVGRVADENLQTLGHLKNVRFLGEKDYAVLRLPDPVSARRPDGRHQPGEAVRVSGRRQTGRRHALAGSPTAQGCRSFRRHTRRIRERAGSGPCRGHLQGGHSSPGRPRQRMVRPRSHDRSGHAPESSKGKHRPGDLEQLGVHAGLPGKYLPLHTAGTV
jgi:hypothetical protein